MALPQLPLVYKKNLSWNDYLTVDVVFGPVTRAFILFLSSFHHELSKVHTQHHFVNQRTIEGTITSRFWNLNIPTHVEIGEFFSFKTFKAGTMELVKVRYETVSP
ncbi:hypothetical protein WDW89_05295 [Deltaproteobacteria bacterium TL4]